jgi:hypothetical protein
MIRKKTFGTSLKRLQAWTSNLYVYSIFASKPRTLFIQNTHIFALIVRIAFNLQLQYYIYQCDMVRGIEDLRTPLSKIIRLDKELRGTLSGFMMPAFVIDLPGGGGKRLVSTYETYDEETGVATYTAPGLDGDKGTQTYTYHDPKVVTERAVEELRLEQEQALELNISLGSLTSPTMTQPGSPMPLSGISRLNPPFIYERDTPRISTAAKIRQTGVKPEDLAPHIGIDNWQRSAATA